MIEERLSSLGVKLIGTLSSAIGSFTLVITGNLSFVSGQILVMPGSDRMQIKYEG